MKSPKQALVVLQALSSPACGLAHERIITNKDGIRTDAPQCPAHIRRTRISCAHCLDTKTDIDARKTFVSVLEFLEKRGALSRQEYIEIVNVVRDADADLNRTDVDKQSAVHNMDEMVTDWEIGQKEINAMQREIDELSEIQRSIAHDLQELLDLARERCLALLQKR